MSIKIRYTAYENDRATRISCQKAQCPFALVIIGSLSVIGLVSIIMNEDTEVPIVWLTVIGFLFCTYAIYVLLTADKRIMHIINPDNLSPNQLSYRIVENKRKAVEYQTYGYGSAKFQAVAKLNNCSSEVFWKQCTAASRSGMIDGRAIEIK